MPAFLVTFLIALAVNIVAYLITPKPKMAKPEAAKSLEDPTAEAGKPVCVPFGSLTIKDPNVLYFGEKSINTYKVKA
ncbi:hypothetical protein I5E68_09900 [Novosphingobium sp. YJ-S2-02]|uniref:Uncharacterized protein n=1 Tax=Novosphingobium aureum TaxID=2792964 RepID=A0A931MKW6_9SPHN|nr:hypothetical protein [Novosphingobium aureum]MBH0113258.1 hypothetical protein [Novosphingobium aureum]